MGRARSQLKATASASRRSANAAVYEEVVLIQSNEQLELLRILPADGSWMRFFTQEEWTAASEAERAAFEARIKVAETLFERGLLKRKIFHYALNWEGQCLREDGELPDTLPALTLEEAVALIAASGAEARFKGGAVISDYRDELDDLSYMEVESAHEDGYERGVATALSWTRDVLARVS